MGDLFGDGTADLVQVTPEAAAAEKKRNEDKLKANSTPGVPDFTDSLIQQKRRASMISMGLRKGRASTFLTPKEDSGNTSLLTG